MTEITRLTDSELQTVRDLSAGNLNLKKPSRYGDRITLEDYINNMSDIEDYINAYSKMGLHVNGDEKILVPFQNIWLETKNPTTVVLLDETSIDNKIDSKILDSSKVSGWNLVEDVPKLDFHVSTNTGGGSSGGGGTTTIINALPWLTDNYGNLQEFGNTAPENTVVKYDYNPDGSPNSQSFVFLVKTAGGLKQFKTWEEVILFLQANTWEKIKKINDFTFNVSSTGGAIAYSEHFGDLDDNTQRTNFMENVKIGYWYTFNIGGNPYQAVIISGDKTSNFIWVGERVIDGANGKTTEFVRGSTSTTGHAEVAGSFTGDAYSSSIALPNAYAPTQYMPTDAIKQLILDNNQTIVSDETDPTWQDLDGTQATLYNASQITITLTDSGIEKDENIQFLLGSNAGNLVLDASVKIYDDVTEAARNGNVAGSYKWYAYAVSTTEVKFVMEDSTGGLTDTSQTIAKIRRVSPNVQRFTGHYTSQAAVLKGAVNIAGVNTGASQEIALPTGITIDNLTGIALTVSGSTDWYEVEGWDKVTAFYISVSNEASNQIWWVEYKIEAVPGDKTKIKITNFKSGNVGTDNAAYNAHWIAFKGGK